MTKLAIGLGLRGGTPAAAIVALVETAQAQLRLLYPALDFAAATLCVPASKQAEIGLQEAALALRLPLVFQTRAALLAMDGAVSTRSLASLQHYGVGSVAEAAALACAGPDAQLVLTRITGAGVTCAVALDHESR